MEYFIHKENKDFVFENDKKYIEVVGIHNYCFTKPFCPSDDNSAYCFSIKIGRISFREHLSFGFSEEYLHGKHYDTLVGWGFGVFGFNAKGEIGPVVSSDFHFDEHNRDSKINEGDILSFVINKKSFLCEISINNKLSFSIYLPKEKIFFCVSGGCYQGISSIQII